MANITQLKHLEHIEDEMLNHGVDGCTASVSAMKEMLKMLGKKPSSGYMQTKWDGAPSVVCGKHPITGRFFVGTTGTGGFGITLTAASTMIYYSNGYDLEKRLQSEARIDRIGQTKPMTYIDLVAEDTIDIKIQKALRTKMNIASDVMGEELKSWI